VEKPRHCIVITRKVYGITRLKARILICVLLYVKLATKRRIRKTAVIITSYGAWRQPYL
jgi:hypothetical protein